MFKQIMEHNTVIDLPLVALIIFTFIFAIVVIRVWRGGRDNPRYKRMAQLPLADDDHEISIVAPEGGDRG